MALKKPCNKSGCKTLCELGTKYCDEHSLLEELNKSQRNKEYDQSIRNRRDEKYTRFYHSAEWESTRESVLNKHNNIDLYAYYILHKIVPASTVHHIQELKEAWELRLNTDNLFPVSDQSHKIIHTLYKKNKQGTQRILAELLKRWEREMRG